MLHDIERYQQHHSVPKGEGSHTLRSKSLRNTRPIVNSNPKQVGKVAMAKEALSDEGQQN
jgi:hypothetical protein